MTVLLYDHSWPGLLSAIFMAYEYKLAECRIEKQDLYQPGMFGESRHVHTDTAKAERLINGLKKKLTSRALGEFYYCFLSEQAGIEDTLLSYTRLTFSSDQNIEHAYTYKPVLEVSQVAKKVHREKHRMEAFVRFQLCSDGFFLAQIAPDFNVLPVILPHFKRRYADQKWLIYDLKRKYGIFYDLEEVTEVMLDTHAIPVSGENSSPVLHQDEVHYEALWKDYFTHVNITERKNTKLHVQHVPKRYWKYLTEKRSY